MSPLHVVILAAGQGSRMKSALPKVLHPVAGKPMLHHVIDTARQLGAEKIHTVIGHGADKVQASLDDGAVNWVMQTEQLGTGHAVAQALPDLPDDARVLVLYGDVPLTSRATLESMVADLDESNLALLTVDME
ncbi:MAG: bifunctional UDP-N-acetylglucosamine pyrophosphorylase / Glucosamine-1-phosphate N-acetyltransferase, partial [Marinobacter sp. T13-3]